MKDKAYNIESLLGPEQCIAVPMWGMNINYVAKRLLEFHSQQSPGAKAPLEDENGETYDMPARITPHRHVQTKEVAEDTPINAMFEIALNKCRIEAVNLELALRNARLVERVLVDVVRPVLVNNEE